jgi:hypothetical protein
VGSGGVERPPLVLPEPVFEQGHVFANSSQSLPWGHSIKRGTGLKHVG